MNKQLFFSYNPVWIINSSVKTHLAFENLICQTRGKVASYKSQLQNTSFPGSCWSLLFPEREPLLGSSPGELWGQLLFFIFLTDGRALLLSSVLPKL